MLARLPSLLLVRLWAALLLAAVGLQAGTAPAATFEQAHGSAFAVDTGDVALLVQRGDRVTRQAVAPEPSLLPVGLRSEVPPGRSAARAVLPAPRPDSTGPPWRDIHSWQPAPRAPPRA
jgi:hypothetical protein